MRSYLTLPTQIGVYAYFDKIQFWVCEPLDFNTLGLLERSCGRGGMHIENRRAPFNSRRRRYRQIIQLRQPSDQALRWLARQTNVLINRVEIAIDFVFTYRGDVEEAWDFLHQHLVRRWHRRSREIRVFQSAPRDEDPGAGETRYDAGRDARNVLVLYSEDQSRVTGELNCLHMELRVTGGRATRAAGIKSGQDLPEFDHRAFWEERLLLYSVDRRLLGRLYRNHLTGRRRRTPEILQQGRYGYDVEGKIGGAAARSCATVQELIDKFKSSIRIRRALIQIPKESLLPKCRKCACDYLLLKLNDFRSRTCAGAGPA